MSPAVLFRTGSDSSAPPGTAKSKTWRQCRNYLADRWFYLSSRHTLGLKASYLFIDLCDTLTNLPLYFVSRFSTACSEKSLQERSSVFGTQTLWPSGTTSPPRPPPHTTRKVNHTPNNDLGWGGNNKNKQTKNIIIINNNNNNNNLRVSHYFLRMKS